MIIGTGIDLCRISRIKRALKSEHLKQKIFSPEEIEYAESKGPKSAESYASSFASREAFIKASGISFSSVMFGKNFTLTRKNGRPEIIYSGFNGAKIFVSITHDGDYACAMVIIEKEDI